MIHDPLPYFGVLPIYNGTGGVDFRIFYVADFKTVYG
jgi:hypothetical protein